VLYQKTLVADGFEVPERLVTPRFTLRKLTIADLDMDFEAVTSSEKHLRGVFGPQSNWPDGLTKERDLADLGWHETEFDLRTSFAYTVVDSEDTTCLGCVYFFPSRTPVYDALCVLWVRSSALADGLDAELFACVKAWLQKEWPFQRVAFPGRTLSWEELEAQNL